MTDTDLTQFRDLYIKTAREYTQMLTKDIATFASERQNQELIATLHRNAHSLKSQSLVMKYMNIGNLSGTMEYAMREIKEGRLQVSSELLSVLQKVVQQLDRAVTAIEKDDSQIDTIQTMHELESVAKVKFVQ